MGKTPAQENRLRAKKQGMSHEDVKKEQAADAKKIKQLEQKNESFGMTKGAAMNKKHEVAMQRLRDMNDPTTELGKQHMRAERKKAKEQLEFLLRTQGIDVKQPPLPDGVDPKTVLCEFFKHGCCPKSADRCKYSHQLDISTRQQKRSAYEIPDEDSIEMWDQKKLEAVIAKKHGQEVNANNETTIVCKHFLQAVEKKLYGWFWHCPGGADCKYRHKLPPGFVFKSELRERMLAELAARKTDQDILREKLIALKKSNKTLTPMTLDVYLKWKTERVEKMKASIEEAREERLKKNLLTGREIIEQQLGGSEAQVDGGASAADDEITRLLKERKAADEEAERKAAEEAAENLARAKNLGDLYNVEMLPDETDDYADLLEEEEEDYSPPEGWTPDAVAPPGFEGGESQEEGQNGGVDMTENEKKAKREAERKALEAEGIVLADKTIKKDKEEELFKPAVEIPDEAFEEAAVDGELDPKKLGEMLAAKRAAEESQRQSELEALAEEKIRKEAAKAAKKAEREAARAQKKKKKKGDDDGEDDKITSIEQAMGKVDIEATGAALKRISTGVLASRPTARDIKIINFSMGMGGRELIKDCDIEVTIGRRYGLIGQNGCGKTNFLECLAAREVPIPDHIDLYHLREEALPSDRTAIQAVIDEVQAEMERLNRFEAHILETTGPDDERLELIYDRLEEIDPTTFEARGSELLHSLGFSQEMIHRPTKDMSGGWRMRVALAKALFASPTLLLLDEPTNHLDLEACVWLEKYLAEYKKCLIIVSHSQDFLNGVCTHIIWLTQQKLTYYTGNYDTFCNTVEENNIVQQKKYEKEQADIKHLKEFIASCGTYSNMRKQAESKQKIIDKMMAAGLTPPVAKEADFKFDFPDCQKVPPPVLPFANVSFAYNGKPENFLYENLELGVDCDTRVALVGPNGAGKSTLLKLMTGELTPTIGTVDRHPALSIGKYHQHSVDVLNKDMNPLEFFMEQYPNTLTWKREYEEWRAYLGRYGITGRMQTQKIGELSEGQQSRLVFAMICMQRPNLLLLDEPTNHLDLEAIDALAEAIKRYNGGLVLVSHDFRLIDQVANQIWVCEDKTVKIWNDDIRAYKKKLARKAEKEAEERRLKGNK
ncbi:P-loop containing nucleoside triphosphate hydrolase protein [Ostreococcus tauri]|uniref:P-loop containing nucleoside triphosphate hydrolase protein n=1 Tax=Ostreococcus tauri TaxID=70448 RepID=A0A1Y5IIN5_OSTTA|nr:P-loop containing nucleoside triphosphate hydrolase protein [Ostreococcus tauri]